MRVKVGLVMDASEKKMLDLISAYYGVGYSYMLSCLLNVAYMAYQRDVVNGTKAFMHGEWPAEIQPPEGWEEGYDATNT